MAKMTPLDPAPIVKLPGDGWELIAAEAGRFAAGLRASIQLWNGELQRCQQISLADSEGWDKFARQVGEQAKVEPELVTKALFTLAGSVENVLRQMAQEGEERGASQATRLVELAEGVELFHSPDGESAFATMEVDGHRETWPLKARGFRRWLARRFFAEEQKTPGSQAVQDALGVLEGKALFDNPEYPVFSRLAEHEGSIYLDLANKPWESVEITPAGWRVVATPPVKFRRAKGMLALPHPVAGGSIGALRDFVNLATEEDWALLAAWLVAASRPQGPYPVLVLHGEQGSAKSTVSRVLRALIDPNAAPVRSESREPRDLMISATNGWVVAYDNMSHLPPWLSDAICRLATGGGFGTRMLYENDEEMLFDATRPVILNGIEELATRGDLLDRALSNMLRRIAPNLRAVGVHVEFLGNAGKSRARLICLSCSQGTRREKGAI